MGIYIEAISEVNCAWKTGAGVGAGDVTASTAYSKPDVKVCFETISEYTKTYEKVATSGVHSTAEIPNFLKVAISGVGTPTSGLLSEIGVPRSMSEVMVAGKIRGRRRRLLYSPLCLYRALRHVGYSC
jgi:hypothetical protein